VPKNKIKNKDSDKLINQIAKILNVTPKVLIKKNDFSKFDEWDSLKHLEIITQIEKTKNNNLKKVKNLSEITSLKKILSLIKD
tara:strand:+ start:1470 stop:1718 length:249 start_codon:yes stop_codon:yes gene_type:complete